MTVAIPAYLMTKEVEKRVMKLESRVVHLEQEMRELKKMVGSLQS